MFIALCQRNRRNLWSVSAPHLLQNCQSRFIYGDDNLSFGGMQNVLCLLVFFKRVKTWKWGTISSSWCESLSDLNTHKHWPNWSLFIRTKFQHTTMFSMTAVRDCGVELLYHPPIWRLPGKQHLAVNHYRSDDEDISGVDDYFVESEASSFSNEIQTLQHRWKC